MGVNAYLDRQEASTSTKKPKTLVVFGPLLDAPTDHPETVLTTLIYMENTWKTFGMQYAHLSVDLQIYQISYLVQWSDPCHWKSLVLLPGMIHTLMSFLGCIGTLTKASGGVDGCSLQPSEESLASSQASHALMQCMPTVSSRQCCSRISSRVAPRRTRS